MNNHSRKIEIQNNLLGYVDCVLLFENSDDVLVGGANIVGAGRVVLVLLLLVVVRIGGTVVGTFAMLTHRVIRAQFNFVTTALARHAQRDQDENGSEDASNPTSGTPSEAHYGIGGPPEAATIIPRLRTVE